MVKPNVVIKKYSDRRLYDTSASRYVKMGDIARMVREGIDVKVVNARSGKDVTGVVLTQIIVEDARDRGTALPLRLLEQLIRTSDRATHDFVSWHLNNALELYQKAQAAVQYRLSEAKSTVPSPLELVRGLLAGQAGLSAPEPVETEKLRRRVEELEAQLARAAGPKRPARKRSV